MHPTIAKAIESMTADELDSELKAERASADSLAMRLGHWMLREWDKGGIGRAVGDYRMAPYKRPPLTEDRIKEMGQLVDRLCHEMNRSTSNEEYRARRMTAMRERLKKARTQPTASAGPSEDGADE